MIEEVNLIKTGSVAIQAGEVVSEKNHRLLRNRNFGRLADSSVFHIKFKGKNYLIDTGYAHGTDIDEKNKVFNEKTLKHDLWMNTKLRFVDITGIFLTHWHPDHFGNIQLFVNAKYYYYDSDEDISPNYINMRERYKKDYRFEGLEGVPLKKDDLFAGCKLFPTPGHTSDHCSLLIPYEDNIICAAGDAIINQTYYETGSIWRYDRKPKESKKSVRKIIDASDIIIPGHGHVFQNYKKTQL